MQETLAEQELSDIETDRKERLALLERVAGSQHFKRATRLREFLLYVGRYSIDDGTSSIHEQEVGTAVFGRRPGYDTSLDNIVRVNATELRKRLELYFGSEGADEPVVLEIPRGSYAPVFRQRLVAPDVPAEGEISESPVPVAAIDDVTSESSVEVAPGETPAAWRRFVPWGAVALLVFTCIGLYWQNTRLERALSPWKNGTASRMLWSQFFDSGQPVDVILADTSFGLAEDMIGREISLSDYLNYDYQRLPQDPAISPDRRADLGNVLGRNNGSIGDFIVAKRILALDPRAATLQLKFAREYSPEAIKTNSVILIGSQESNPWVELFADRLNFSLDYDAAQHQAFVRNHRPKPGEQEIYARAANPATREGYSVVAFLPDLSKNGNALIIAGTDSQATRAAGEFVTSDDLLDALRKKLGANDRFPYFEVLLHNLQIKGTPLRSEILAVRNDGETTPAIDSGHGGDH
jgi:hypothetical protein